MNTSVASSACESSPFAPLKALLPTLRDRQKVQFARPKRGGAIELISGDLFYPLDPDPEIMTPEVISSGLSNTCRFGGQCKAFYSVAQHSVLVAALSPEDMDAQKWALLHDAEEGFGLPDLPSPLKPSFPEVVEAQDRLAQAVALRYGLKMSLKKLVKPADRMALAIESKVLKIGKSKSYWDMEDLPNIPQDVELIPFSSKRSNTVFLEAWDRVFSSGKPITLSWLKARNGLKKAA